MKSRIRLCIVILILSVLSSVSAENGLWQIIDQTHPDKPDIKSDLRKKSLKPIYQNALMLKLDEQSMRLRLQTRIANSKQAKNSNPLNTIDIPVPLPDGKSTILNLVPDDILPARLADKFPEITTYRILPNKQIFSGKVDMTPNGFHAMLNTFDGEVVFVDPIDNESNFYASYKKSEQKRQSDRNISCGVGSQDYNLNDTSNENTALKDSPNDSQRPFSESPGNLLNYRIAIAATGEYSAKHGGTVESALSAITTTLSRVNQVLERDLGIQLILAENNDLLINIDASSDPFTETELTKLVYQNQTYLDAIIGTENYDIGHLFTASGGGLAAIASVCNGSDKAKGISGIQSPRGDSFDLDFVAHEIGHQLGATHTFNSSQGLCAGNTRTARTAFEPGSGSSIMSYAGYCGLDNLQSNTDAMYHIGSIQQIYEYTNSGQGSYCGTRNAVQNQAPIPDAGKNAIIPARTPFELTGKAVDADGDDLLYAWEQLDAGESSAEYTDTGNNALFRVYNPSDKKQRSFPPLPDILNHSPSKGETLPDYQRAMRFAFVAQDGFSVAKSDEISIQVERTGSRFALNLPRSQYTVGETYQIFWNVADTNLPPVNCQNVDISLSIDGGFQFTHELATNVANNGTAWVTIPVTSETSNHGRFKLKCSDNIFFALSYRDFVITDKTTQVTYKYNDENQPEPDLKDRELVIAVVNNGANDNSGIISDSAGGSFDFYLFFLAFLVIRQARIANKGT